jgi:hypothetical protein
MTQEILIPMKLIFDFESNSDNSVNIEKITIKNLEIDFVSGFAVADSIEEVKTQIKDYDTASV